MFKSGLGTNWDELILPISIFKSEAFDFAYFTASGFSL
jgi:hypothetical protein